MSTHSVTELRDAWRAGDSRYHVSEALQPVPSVIPDVGVGVWTPSATERVIAVVGCGGGVGASTVAVALATATGASARVVECCPALGSGLAAASNAELGIDGGWRRGTRGAVVLERRTGTGRVTPVPVVSAVEWTILDAGWTALVDPSVPWLSALLRSRNQVVLVTNATVPGMRRLESFVDHFAADVLGVVVGPASTRWSRPVKVAATGLPLRLRLVDFPLDRQLQVTGLTPDPLPPPLIKAAVTILAQVRKEPR